MRLNSKEHVISFPLTLRPAGRAIHAAAAWFIPGDDPGDWLAEIVRWGVATAGLRLYVLPASMRDRTPAGVLVIGTDLGGARDVRRALPYGVLAGRLYLPVDARL